MKILALGSSGQIGGYLVPYLRARDHEVTEFDMKRNPSEDLRRSHSLALEKAVRDSDFVFFLAFDVGGSRYLAQYQHTYDFIDNNVRLLTNTFDALDYFKKPFVFASSQMSNMSYSSYGTLKSLGEFYTKASGGRIVKFWNVYGIEHDYEKSHVITDLILKAKQNGIVDLLTNGEEHRQFLYAEDCCEALEMVMNRYNEFTPDSNLHITSFESTAIIYVAKIIADHFRVSMGVPNIVDPVQMDKRNEPDPFILQYWKPKTSLQEGIELVIKGME